MVRFNQQPLQHLIAQILTAVGVIAMVVHFTVRDSIAITQTLFFATPPVLVAAVLAIGGVTWWILRGRRAAVFCWVLATGCLVWWAAVFFHRPRPSLVPPQDRVRIVLWNVQHRLLEDPEILAHLMQLEPDVIALAEATYDRRGLREMKRRLFPNYQMSPMRRGMVLLCKGRMQRLDDGRLDGDSLYQQAQIQIGGKSLRLVQVDIASNPFKSRRRAMQRLQSLLHGSHDEPVVVLGDFNTPAQSAQFDALRLGFRNAYESAGAGYGATWPMPLPVLQLDQVWVNHQLTTAACRTEWTWRTDHRPVVVEVGFPRRSVIVRGKHEIEADVIEDRGNIGVAGRQLVRIRLDDALGEHDEFEAAAERTRLIEPAN